MRAQEEGVQELEGEEPGSQVNRKKEKKRRKKKKKKTERKIIR